MWKDSCGPIFQFFDLKERTLTDARSKRARRNRNLALINYQFLVILFRGVSEETVPTHREAMPAESLQS